MAGGLVRRQLGRALSGSGQLLSRIGDLVAGQAPRSVAPLPLTGGPARSPSATLLDARSTDIGTLRRLALACTLAAARDPRRPAPERLAAQVCELSDWAAGRLLAEAGRAVQTATALAGAGADGRPPARSRFAEAVRRAHPWLDDAALDRLYEYAWVSARRGPAPEGASPGPAAGATGEPDPARGRVGGAVAGAVSGMVGRLRRSG